MEPDEENEDASDEGVGLSPEILAELLAIENQGADDISEWIGQDMGDYERQYRNTGNPLYVWFAIAVVARDEWRPVYGRHPDVVVPVWCLDYLRTCATELSSLAHDVSRQRIMAKPTRRSRKLSEPTEAAAKASRRESAAIRALRQIPRALGFAPSSGRSAFRSYAADALNRHWEDSYGISIIMGSSAREARASTLTEMGTDNEQVLRRVFARSRKFSK